MRYLGFFATFFLVYGGMHAYALRVLARAFPARRLWRWAPLCLLLALAPMLARFLERAEYPALSQPLAWFAYLWMGLLFLFVVSAAALELLWAAVSLLAFVLAGRRGLFAAAARGLCLLALGGAALVFVLSWREARQPVLEEVTIFSEKIPAGVAELRLVQLSDLHLGPLLEKSRLRTILALVRAARPDILVATGDIVDGQEAHLDGSSALFREIPAPLGKYAVLGNHERYVGVEQAVAFLEAAGFTVLRDEAREVAGLLAVAGSDDPGRGEEGALQAAREALLLGRLPADRFRLFLKHRPLLPEEGKAAFDLQLSGHVHQGQIFPFVFLVRRAFPHPTGLLRLGGGKYLYTSRGAGTWGPPLRFLAPPEVTLIRLRPLPASAPARGE